MLGLIFSISVLFNVAFAGLSFPDQKTSCSRGGCKNPCELRGLSCCYCDQTASWNLDACFCCPKDHVCCPSQTWASLSRPHCCPTGYTCGDNGRCTAQVNEAPAYAEGVCNSGCRKGTSLFITADDEIINLSVDGVKQNLPYKADWTTADTVNLPANTQEVTFCAKNDQYKAGILAYIVDQTWLDGAKLECYEATDMCSGTTFNPAFAGPAFNDEKNDGASTRKNVVNKIPTGIYYFWCNNPNSSETKQWMKYCRCRITFNVKKDSY